MYLVLKHTYTHIHTHTAAPPPEFSLTIFTILLTLYTWFIISTRTKGPSRNSSYNSYNYSDLIHVAHTTTEQPHHLKFLLQFLQFDMLYITVTHSKGSPWNSSYNSYNLTTLYTLLTQSIRARPPPSNSSYNSYNLYILLELFRPLIGPGVHSNSSYNSYNNLKQSRISTDLL